MLENRLCNYSSRVEKYPEEIIFRFFITIKLGHRELSMMDNFLDYLGPAYKNFAIINHNLEELVIKSEEKHTTKNYIIKPTTFEEAENKFKKTAYNFFHYFNNYCVLTDINDNTTEEKEIRLGDLLELDFS